jgi:hypothetical protein
MRIAADSDLAMLLPVPFRVRQSVTVAAAACVTRPVVLHADNNGGYQRSVRCLRVRIFAVLFA